MDLHDKHIVITGASGGLGQALAAQLANAGANLLLIGRRGDKLEKLLQSLPNMTKHRRVAVDIGSDEGRLKIAECAMESGLDVLINNAAINNFGLLEQQSATSISRQIHTNLTSTILLTQHLLPLLRSSPESAIVNIGSSLGAIGYPGYSVYCASKFGLRGFSEALRRELADTQIRVLHIAPRTIDTSINSAAAVAMNEALGNTADHPQDVACIIVRQLQKKFLKDRAIGWPERLFIKVNALVPALVDASVRKQLPIIRKFTNQQPSA